MTQSVTNVMRAAQKGRSVALHTYAKLNLSLLVHPLTPQESLHKIDSIFQSISLHDKISITQNPKNKPHSLTVSGPIECSAENNLILRAINILEESLDFSCAIHLEKHIPIGAGLGGGSSNAAAMLWWLNTQCKTPKTNEELKKIAVTLGSDIPFFFEGGTMFVSGYGEDCTPLKSIKTPLYYLLIYPNVGSDTKKAYQDFDASTPPFISQQESDAVRLGLNRTNSFKEVVFSRIPILKTLEHALNPMGPTYLSGSGSTIFLSFDTLEKAQTAYSHVVKIAADHSQEVVLKEKTMLRPFYTTIVEKTDSGFDVIA